MSPRTIYLLQVTILLLMLLSYFETPPLHIAAMAIGAISIERLYKPLCVGIIQRIAKA